MITLSAHLSSDLAWDETLFTGGGPFFLDFGWERAPLDPFSELHYNSNCLAVQELVKRVKGGGVCLLKASGAFASLIRSTPKVESLYEEFCEEKNPFTRHLFCATLLSDYLHKVASFLDDLHAPFIEIIPSPSLSKGELALLFCKRRFPYFSLFDPNRVFPHNPSASIGILLPEDSLYVPSKYLPYVARKEYRLIPEELFSECWDGLDLIYFDSETIGEIGKRMVQGFEAAGGEKKELSQSDSAPSE